MELKIKIKVLTGEVFDLSVDDQISIPDLKAKIGNLTEKDPATIRLIYKAKNLESKDKLCDYGKLIT